LAAEWAANSYLDGSITVGRHIKALVPDARLHDTVRSFIPSELPTNNDGDDALDPAVAAYLLALESVPGSLSELDCRLMTEIDRLQHNHGVSGSLLQIGANSPRTPILLAYLSTPSEPLTVCDTGHDDPGSTRNLLDGKKFEHQTLRFHDRMPETVVGRSIDSALGTRAPRFRLLSMEGPHRGATLRDDMNTARRLLVDGGIAVLEMADMSSLDPGEVFAEQSFQPICSTESRLFVAGGPIACSWAQALPEWAARHREVGLSSRPLGDWNVWHLAAEPPARPIGKDGLGRTSLAEGQRAQELRDAAYDADFYDFVSASARSSAQEIVPLVLELTDATSVVDVGCGTGTWLSVFKRHGVSEVLGIDGTHVERSRLEISATDFVPWDLEQPLPAVRRFDLALCLEVAEHVSPDRADAFITEVAGLAPIVLFSAAIPFQGGHGHVNEQWPSYWVRKFADQGMSVIDAVRPQIWDNDRVAMWYSQNCLLFASTEALDERPGLLEQKRLTNLTELDLVHPSMYLYHRLGLDRTTAPIPLDTTRWQPDTPERRFPIDDSPTGDAVESEDAGRQADIGLRELLRRLPNATRFTIGSRWKSLRRR